MGTNYNDIGVSQETENKIKSKAPDNIPLNATAQGWTGQGIRRKLVQYVLDNQDSILSVLKSQLEIVKNHFIEDKSATTGEIDTSIVNHNNNLNAHEALKLEILNFLLTQIEQSLSGKADLVNGKVPREQMDDYFDDIIEGFYINPQFYSEGEENEDYLITPELGKLYVDVDTNVLYRWIGAQYEKVTDTFELTKAKIEEKLTGDITSHNHATEIGNHNTSETAHTGIRNAVAEAKAIAEGKSRARVFATKSALDTWLLDSENVALLQIGDNFYIEEIDKPDYWWNGTTIKELETQKVDLTDYAKTIDLPTKVSDLTNDSGFLTSLPTHNHDDAYYKKSETYTKAQTDALVGNLQGQTQELKSITTQPSGTFVVGDLYYNSSTKGMYYWNGTSWELTGLGVPMTGIIYSFNGILYFWDESTLNLIQIGAGGTGGWELTIKEGFFA